MKTWLCAALAAVITMCVAVPVKAGTAKISSVKLRLQIEDSDGEPEITVKSCNNKYDVSDVDVNAVSFYPASGPAAESYRKAREMGAEEKEDESVCEIELYASENYQFDTMKQKDIKITGIEGVCTKAVRKEKGTSLVLSVSLTGLDQYVGSMGEIRLKNGRAEWAAAANAATYELSLYKGGRKESSVYETAENIFDFSPLITEPGQYTCKVSPVSSGDKKGRAAESSAESVSAEQAESNRNMCMDCKPGWQQTDGGWRYRNPELIFIQGNWIQDGEDWYYFNSAGDMEADKWIVWKNKWYYLGTDGKLS